MEEASARREAERGTFDPTYLVYTVGKLMLLKLRQDYKQQQGKAFSLRTFHDTLLGNGTAPFWLHRQLMLGPTMPAICLNEQGTGNALVRIRMRRVRSPLREDSEVFRSARWTTCPKCGGPVHKLQSVAGDSVQGHRLLHHRLRRRRTAGGAAKSGDGRDGQVRQGARRPEKTDKSDKSDEGDKTEKSDKTDEAASESATSEPRRRPTLEHADAAAGDRRRRARRRTRSASTRLTGGVGRSSDLRYAENLLGEIRPAQREVDHRLQESELVAGVVADAFDFAGVDRPRLQQLAQAVGQLDLAGAIALGRRQRREDIRRQHVAADDRQVGRRFVARRLLDQIAHLVDALAEIARPARSRSRRSSRCPRAARARPRAPGRRRRSNTSISCLIAGGSASMTSSPRMTANGSSPTSSRVTSTAWPRPSGSPWRT